MNGIKTSGHLYKKCCAIRRNKQVTCDLVNGREETLEKERILPEARMRNYKKTGQKWNDFKNQIICRNLGKGQRPRRDSSCKGKTIKKGLLLRNKLPVECMERLTSRQFTVKLQISNNSVYICINRT